MALALPEAGWAPPPAEGGAIAVPLVAAVLLHGAIGALLVLGVIWAREIPEPAGGLVVELVFAAQDGEPAEPPLTPLPLADEPRAPSDAVAMMAPVDEPPPVLAVPQPAPAAPAVPATPAAPAAPVEQEPLDPILEPPPMLAMVPAAPPLAAAPPPDQAPAEPVEAPPPPVEAPAAPPPAPVPPQASAAPAAPRARPTQPTSPSRPRPLSRSQAGTQAARGAAADAPASMGAPAEPPGPPLITTPRFRHPPRPPEYPRRAVELDLSGTVVVRALLDPAGTPRETRVHRSSGHPILDAAAVAAVRRWAFEPASVGGRHIEAWVEVPVRFRLH